MPELYLIFTPSLSNPFPISTLDCEKFFIFFHRDCLGFKSSEMGDYIMYLIPWKLSPASVCRAIWQGTLFRNRNRLTIRPNFWLIRGNFLWQNLSALRLHQLDSQNKKRAFTISEKKSQNIYPPWGWALSTTWVSSRSSLILIETWVGKKKLKF